MAALAEDLCAWLTAVVGPLVDRPEAVMVRVQAAGGVLVAAVTVDDADVGRLIGERGRCIRALQDLAARYGHRRGVRIVLHTPQGRLGCQRDGP